MHRKQGSLRATNFFEKIQIGCGTRPEAEIAAYSFRKMTERDDNPKCSDLFNLDFINAFDMR